MMDRNSEYFPRWTTRRKIAQYQASQDMKAATKWVRRENTKAMLEIILWLTVILLIAFGVATIGGVLLWDKLHPSHREWSK